MTWKGTQPGYLLPQNWLCSPGIVCFEPQGKHIEVKTNLQTLKFLLTEYKVLRVSHIVNMRGLIQYEDVIFPVKEITLWRWDDLMTVLSPQWDFHCGDKTILQPSYLHNRISYTGKMTSLHWIRAQGSWWFGNTISQDIPREYFSFSTRRLTNLLKMAISDSVQLILSHKLIINVSHTMWYYTHMYLEYTQPSNLPEFFHRTLLSWRIRIQCVELKINNIKLQCDIKLWDETMQ